MESLILSGKNIKSLTGVENEFTGKEKTIHFLDLSNNILV
jgi:hypothetical protein